MSEDKRELLTVGAFFIVLVVGILLYVAGLIDWTLIPPIVLVLFGIWMIALAAIRSSSPMKYERSAFSTLGIGLLLVAIGGAWYLATFNWLYSVVLVLLAVGALAIVAALKRK